MTNGTDSLATALADTLAFLGLDAVDAAQLLGVSPRTLRRWLEGEEIPGPAQAALRAWRELHSRHLAWKPDSIAVFENDAAQIERARQHAQEVETIIKTVEARGGPKNPWSVNMVKCLATFGPFEVGFYKLQNGGFSFSAYRRKDTSPDLERDRPYLEDAAYSISRAFSKAGASAQALRAVAQYTRLHSGVFVQDGARSLTAAERRRREQEIEAIADKLDGLADAVGGSADYAQFEALLHQLHGLGFFPTIDLVSDVAKAML
ncbi:helix-turn-helix domain-containing protein [Bradyrhizobium elkanii]|uniref:Helix-turn-helix domain-containing protein n=1 Tax=Bradyrhizobium elkanii TaxID=29448 RepID=A0A4U6RXW1_BRAEL|nr:helix-turn-helix domain-containing protein [Bradyrhizobium elkanii]TKV80087.1 helix-turn-helix domain-containing protein [Bradyrhizobium elkanii]